MDKGLIFENLLHVAQKEEAVIRLGELQGHYGLLKGKRIALNIGMGIDKMNYTLAHELAHLFLHADQGDTINSDRHEEYEEQADYAAKFLLHCMECILNEGGAMA